MDFIVAATHIRAHNYGLKCNMTREEMRTKAADVMVPEFVPKSGVKIQVNENESNDNASDNPGIFIYT